MILSVQHVYAGYQEKNVLHDISFSVKSGENLSIVGPNGCGKTTLLRTIADIIPFQGDIQFDGESVQKMQRKEIARHVAVMSQMNEHYLSFSVWETVMMGRYIYRARSYLANPSTLDHQQVEQALKSVDMLKEKNREIATLSGGQLQRVLLAKVLAQDPSVILLDEPTNHIDLRYQIEMVEFLKQWSKGNQKSVIAVLHDINLAAQFADQMLVLDEGRIAAFDNTRTIIKSEFLNQVYKMDVTRYMKSSMSIWD